MDYRHHRPIGARRIIIGALLAIVCGYSAAQAAGSIPLRTENLYGVSVHIQYPVVVGATAAVLNPIIQGWVGSNCDKSPVIRNTYAARTTYRGPKDCVAALSKECAALQAESGSSLLAVGPCQAVLTAKVEMNTDGMLAISLYNFGSIEHGFMPVPNQSANVEYLNLDIANGRALDLPDLLYPSYTAPLQQMIVRALRAQFHIPNRETLMQAGFVTNDPPIPTAFEILTQGLKFSYHPGEITRRSVAPPDVLVSYTQLSSLIPEDGPLRRLLRSSQELN